MNTWKWIPFHRRGVDALSPPLLSLSLSSRCLSATLNNSLTVRADLAHQLTDKYLKRKAVRWEQSALFTSQANPPLVCDGGGVLGGGLADGPAWAARTVAVCTSAASPPPTIGEDTSVVSDPPAHLRRRKCHRSSSPEPQMRLCSLMRLWTFIPAVGVC